MRTIGNPALDSWENDEPGCAVMGETASPQDALEQIDEMLAQHGLEVVIHNPTVALQAVKWGFTIERLDVCPPPRATQPNSSGPGE